MPTVNTTKPEYDAVLPKWTKIADCIEGQDAVKSKGAVYLPQPNPSDKSKENKTRFTQYIERAMFYNVTARTLNGLVGLVFSKDITAELPTLLQPLVENIDGAGVTLEQQSKKALNRVIAFGRCGLLTDHPNVEGSTTREDLVTGTIRPSVILYEPTQIINWRTEQIASKTVLTMVVLQESTSVVNEDDPFIEEEKTIYRVLRLDTETMVYYVEIYEEQTKGRYTLTGQFFPIKSDGTAFDTIPFTFVGVENNDAAVDLPPLYDLANLNIAHYRNSADYEESTYIVGQPTPWFSGLTEDWVNNVMKGKAALGSRGGISLPEGGAAGLLQASPNAMPKEGMELKEKQMVSLGAKLVEEDQVNVTATKTKADNASETSILGAAAKNVSDAYQLALEWAAMFVGVTDEINVELSTDFTSFMLTAQDRMALIAEWQAGAIDFEELRDNLKRAGVASKEDEEVRENIEAETGGALDVEIDG